MYIHSVCSISALPIIRTREPLPELLPNEGLSAIEPVYNDHIPPMQSRRMTKGMKMGLVAALDCMRQVDCTAEKLQAIEVGTAYGLLRDSEAFLANMIGQNEKALNPTAFIQSTHNTVSGAIALRLKAHVHNITFVQKGHSFEHALLDADLSLQGEGLPSDKMVLLGAIDERIDILKRLLGERRPGIGEAASFLLLGNSSGNAIAKIRAYRTFRTNKNEVVAKELKEVLLPFESDAPVEQAPIILWNSTQPLPLRYGPEMVDLSDVVGYNPTGSALALVIGAKFCQERKCTSVVVNQFKDYWSIFELA